MPDLRTCRRLKNVALFSVLLLIHSLISGGIYLPSQITSSIGGVGHMTAPTALIASPDCWALERIQVTEVHRQGEIGQGIVVAVIDTGIASSSIGSAQAWFAKGEIPGNGLDDDVNGYVDDVHGWDFLTVTPVGTSYFPQHWHGTFVAGLIVDDCLGVAPGAQVMDLCVTDASGAVQSWDVVVEAIRYAVDNGASIINISLAFYSPPPPTVLCAIQYASSRNVEIVGIAGNGGGTVAFPGRLEGVWAVSAVDSDGVIAGFSGHGDAVDLAAPGVDVPSVLPGGGYAIASGTSFAAAYVSGALAVLMASAQSSPCEWDRLLFDSATDLGVPGYDDVYGEGHLNIGQAVELVFSRALQNI